MADIVAGFAIPEQDVELIEELQAGSDRAFAFLVATYQRPIYNFVFRLLEDPADAPDVTQEVFLKVFRNIGEFRAECSLKTWIYRIAVNEASNLRRWFSRHRRNETSLDEREQGCPALADVLADTQETQYERVLRHERMRAVETALSQVKESFRVTVVLRDIEGLSYEEIAEVMQVSLGTVKSRILRGREALKHRLLALRPQAAPLRAMAPCVLQAVEE
ncbi:MAG: sigma-70 family RNA polymerase sigma factor [Acidobacteria bacterium]|nr:sigma-70 family RNA polymerase sigma factor [Acidobacteriota bacterium]